MRSPVQRRTRRGAVAVEGAIIGSAFLLLMLLIFDIGIAVFRQFTISQAARHGARQAIVHGPGAPTAAGFGGPWGPSQVSVAANANDPRALAIRPMCQTCNLAQTQITVQWLDGNNNVGSRVRVTVTTPYQPILTSLLTSGFTLTASSTMIIAH